MKTMHGEKMKSEREAQLQKEKFMENRYYRFIQEYVDDLKENYGEEEFLIPSHEIEAMVCLAAQTGLIDREMASDLNGQALHY